MAKVYYKVITGTGWIKAKENEINDVLAKRDDYAKRHPEYPCLKVKRVVKVTEEEVDLTNPL